MKIFGIGLNKTGTTTLGECFKLLGFSNIGCEPDIFRLYKENDFNGLFDVIQKYESFEDWPWPMIYKEIDKAFPESKFILTIRKSADVWYNSLCKYAERSGPTEYREVIYGYTMPHDYCKHHISFYNSHNHNVRKYFEDKRDNFLEVCWEKGHGWDELCAFLNMNIPLKKFPYANKYTMMKGFKGKIKSKILK